MKAQKFLSKERELELGYIIRDYYKEKDKGSKADARIIARGEAAVNELIENNTLLVRKIAVKFRNQCPNLHDLDDLIQFGMLGIVKAVEKYDPDRNNKFSTMAWNWVKASIIRGANETKQNIHIPENKIFLSVKIRDRQRELEDSGLNQTEVYSILSQEFGMNTVDINQLQQVSKQAVSLSAPIPGTDNELIDVITDSYTQESTENSVLRKLVYGALNKAVDELEEKERWALAASVKLPVSPTGETPSPTRVKMKFGLDSNEYRKSVYHAKKRVREALLEQGFTAEDFNL